MNIRIKSENHKVVLPESSLPDTFNISAWVFLEIVNKTSSFLIQPVSVGRDVFLGDYTNRMEYEYFLLYIILYTVTIG